LARFSRLLGLRCEPAGPVRNRVRGFTLFEALIAFALTALVIGGTIRMFSWAIAQQEKRVDDLLLAEFAVAILAEYSATYPAMALSGTADGGWNWAITETPVLPDKVEALRSQISYVQLTARVWQDVEPDQAREFSSLFALRTKP
jgi:hypothetical protein